MENKKPIEAKKRKRIQRKAFNETCEKYKAEIFLIRQFIPGWKPKSLTP